MRQPCLWQQQPAHAHMALRSAQAPVQQLAGPGVPCRHPDQVLCVLWLGSSIGNLEPDEALQFFRDILRIGGSQTQVRQRRACHAPHRIPHCTVGCQWAARYDASTGSVPGWPSCAHHGSSGPASQQAQL